MKEARELTSNPDNNNIFKRLPLLESVSESYSLEERRPFTNYKILVTQHLLGSTASLISMFERGGAKPEDIHIVGKAYSSHPNVVDGLSKRGYKISERVFDYEEDKPYDSTLEENIKTAVDNIVEETDFENDNYKGLLIDDGGKAIKMLHESYPGLIKHFVCIEQTSRGARALQNVELLTPVINVARSEAKTIHESPLIAHSMVTEFMSSLKRWQDIIQLHDNRVFLLGYGFIGENVQQELSEQGFDISVYDPDPDKMKRAQAQNLPVVSNRSEAYPASQIIIGCTGNPSIPLEEFNDVRPGSLLVNMASTDTEFSAWELRKKGKVVHEHTLLSDRHRFSSSSSSPLPWRSLYRVEEGNTYFYLANGGFPIDFSGSIDPIPPDKIQLTRALLLGAAIQAVDTHEQGLVDLDKSMQDDVVRKYLQLQK